MSAETPSVASLLSGSQQGPGATNVGSVDNLTCQWDNCGERTTSPETLYVCCSPIFLLIHPPNPARVTEISRHANPFILGACL